VEMLSKSVCIKGENTTKKLMMRRYSSLVYSLFFCRTFCKRIFC